MENKSKIKFCVKSLASPVTINLAFDYVGVWDYITTRKLSMFRWRIHAFFTHFWSFFATVFFLPMHVFNFKSISICGVEVYIELKFDASQSDNEKYSAQSLATLYRIICLTLLHMDPQGNGWSKQHSSWIVSRRCSLNFIRLYWALLSEPWHQCQCDFIKEIEKKYQTNKLTSPQIVRDIRPLTIRIMNECGHTAARKQLLPLPSH